MSFGSPVALPEEHILAVCHECKWTEALLLPDCLDVLEHLLLANTSIAAGALCLNNSKNFTLVGMVQTIVGDTFFGLRVVTGDGDLKPDLRPVGEIPPGFLQLGINEVQASCCLANTIR